MLRIAGVQSLHASREVRIRRSHQHVVMRRHQHANAWHRPPRAGRRRHRGASGTDVDLVIAKDRLPGYAPSHGRGYAAPAIWGRGGPRHASKVVAPMATRDRRRGFRDEVATLSRRGLTPGLGLGDFWFGAAAVGSDLDGKTSSLIQSSCVEEVRGRLRERDHDPVGQLEPASLRFAFSSWIRSSTRFSTTSSWIERRVERDREPVAVRDRPALACPTCSTSTSSAERSWPTARKPPFDSHEVARVERRAHRAELLAELRPEHREVRLDAELCRLDLAELDLLHA